MVIPKQACHNPCMTKQATTTPWNHHSNTGRTLSIAAVTHVSFSDDGLFIVELDEGAPVSMTRAEYNSWCDALVWEV
jgi:hypothetical protein